MYGELGWLRRIQWSVLNLLYSNSGCSDKAAGDLTSDHSRDITKFNHDVAGAKAAHVRTVQRAPKNSYNLQPTEYLLYTPLTFCCTNITLGWV